MVIRRCLLTYLLYNFCCFYNLMKQYAVCEQLFYHFLFYKKIIYSAFNDVKLTRKKIFIP